MNGLARAVQGAAEAASSQVCALGIQQCIPDDFNAPPAVAICDTRSMLLMPQGILQGLEITNARSQAEFRAAGYLRAYSFYSFPPDRSEFAARVSS